MPQGEPFLDALHDVLARHYADHGFATSQIARRLAVSERHLQRKVNELTGYTPAQYLRAYRLRRALELLQAGTPIGRVARSVGFASHAYFTSCFKAEFGVTPSRFQQGWCAVDRTMSLRRKSLARR